MQKICKKNVGKNASGKNMQENMQENMKDSMQENMTNVTNYLFCIFSENMLPLMT
jgi:ribosomal protein S3AE